MYKYFILAGLLALSACHKTTIEQPAETPPVMDYTEFNQEISFGQSFFVDIDQNGSKDFLFYTELVGDPILKRDYRQFHIGSSYAASLAVDSITDETPALAKNTAISFGSPQGFNWYNASGVWLARKVIGTTEAPFWEGGWKNASHQFLAVRVDRAGLGYYGWLEVSFDSNAEKVILYRAAICREAGREIKAGA